MSDSLSLFLSNFCEDLLLSFLGYLDDLSDYKHVFLTHKKFMHLAEGQLLWQHLLKKYFSQEIQLYYPLYKKDPHELFKTLYLLRLKLYYQSFNVKKSNPIDYLLFKNMILARVGEIDKTTIYASQKLMKTHAYLLSQGAFGEVEEKYFARPDDTKKTLYNEAFIFCCRHNHAVELNIILTNYHAYLDLDKNLKIGLSESVKFGHLECLETLCMHKNVIISTNIIGEIFTLSCALNKTSLIAFLYNSFHEQISNHLYGHAVIAMCSYNNEMILSLFFEQPKKNLFSNQVIGALNAALKGGHLRLADTLMSIFRDLLEQVNNFEVKLLYLLVQEQCLSGFVFLFKKMPEEPNLNLISGLLRTAYQKNAFDIMRFFLEGYSDKLPSFLKQQVETKLNQPFDLIPLVQQPTLLFSEGLNHQIDFLVNKLESLKLTHSEQVIKEIVNKI